MMQHRLAYIQVTVAFVATIICLSYSTVLCARESHLGSFPALLASARKLQSAQGDTSALSDEVYAFIREPKKDHCDSHYEYAAKTLNEYRSKAYAYVSDSKKKTNWLGGLAQRLTGPLGAMKSLSKFDSLKNVTDRYEAQFKDGKLTQADVDCDMNKVSIRILETIVFVLETEIYTLVDGARDVVNTAIYNSLKADNFVVTHNFYDTEKLTPKQQELLLKLISGRSNSAVTTIGEALDRFYDIGSLIVGRLADTCQGIFKYLDDWKVVDDDRKESCANQTSDPDDKDFTSRFNVDKYEKVRDFCSQFLQKD